MVTCKYCEKKCRAKGLCINCYKKFKWREKKGLDLDLTKNVRKKHKVESIKTIKRSKAKKGCLRKDGYISVQIKGKRYLQHTYIMMNFLGRDLMKHESIHHKNGCRDDNRIENLELWSSSHPSGQRVEDKIKWCKEFLKLYDTM